MGEDEKEAVHTESSNVSEILRERDRLDRMLQDKFKKEVTVLFTDICGYTQYMDTRGDISGRAMLQQHNDIIFPLVEKRGGTVVKTIGDAVMATFSSPIDAVKTSIDIQEELFKYNRKADPANRIHVKIGINTGEALMEESDVFGDAVNVASRIQSQAGKDEILISQSSYGQVRESEDILCRFHGTVQVKGKSRPLELYRVVWKNEDVVVRGETRARASMEKRPKVFNLEATREGNHLKISAHEQTAKDTSTIQHFEEIRVSMDWIETRCQDMVETLNKFNRSGRVSREGLKRLRDIGRVFSDELFTSDLKEKLNSSNAEYLILNLDEHLVQMPWELLHDGRQFLCQRFNMGRLVRTRQAVSNSMNRVLERPLRMLMLADPSGDLKGAYSEGIQIRDIMDEYMHLIHTTSRSENVTPEFIKEKIRNFDIVHFAGHADYDRQNPEESGWRLSRGNLKVQHIKKMAGTASMPALIFSNACQSARTEMRPLTEHFQEEIFGVASAFLLAGVRHYVGTFWEVLDEPSSKFAVEFYNRFISGMTMGEAIREARLALIKEYGEENIVWASYLLYGDPTSNYIDQIKDEQVKEEGADAPPMPTPRPPMESADRTRDTVIDFGERDVQKRNWTWWAIAAGVFVLGALLLWGYPGFLRIDIMKYEKALLTYYQEGDFKKALSASKALEEKEPQIRLIYLIQGDVYFRKGNLDAAKAAYQKALEVTKGTDQEKAKAFMGLGRIASIRKQTDQALNYYRSATKAAPDNGSGYLSQALVLEDKGDYEEALPLLKKAQSLMPKDQILTAVIGETNRKVGLSRDHEKQERINRMVKELLETMKTPPRALLSDGWTSYPLTLWIRDFSTQGYSLQEGGEKLLDLGITEELLSHSRAQVVERALLDKLLEELKLGSSKMVDRSTALSLGKILAARLILSGQVTYAGPMAQVSVRLIETETGRITLALNRSFGSAVPSSAMAEQIGSELLQKLNELYPLRGKISGIKENEVTLNIGQRTGVRIGQRFKVVGSDIILEGIGVRIQASLARVASGKDPLADGLRVEAIN